MTHQGKEIQMRKAVGLQIKGQLRQKFIQHSKAAELSGLTPAQISAITKGTRNYTIDTLTKLVEALGLELEFSNEIFQEYKQKYGL
jgi:transcriptional regulator with XRE-family HTH domain